MNRRISGVIQGVLFGATLAVLGAIMTTPAYAQLHRSPAASNGSAVAADVFKVQYFDSGTVAPGTTITVTSVEPGDVGGLGDGLVRTINPTSTPQICEMVYVFDGNEEQQECCGCVVTNDGLRVQTVEGDLTSNPSNGVDFYDGIIKIVSSLPNTAAPLFCNPALAPSLAPALRPSISHSEVSGAVRSVSVQSFDDAPLDQTELNTLVATCAFIHTNQSGAGRCTCGRGDVVPARPHAGR